MAPGTSGQYRTLGEAARHSHAQRNQYADAALEMREGAGTSGERGTQAARKSEPGSPRAPQGALAPQGKTMTGASVYAALSAASHRAAGCSQKETVWQSGKLTLYRYRPVARPTRGVPLLNVYALGDRPYMMDLQEDRSLIRGLLAEGVDVYLIDWGFPDGADRFTTLADSIDHHLAGCVDQILKTRRLRALNLLGVCQGGVLSLCFSALHPQLVRNLITMVTPVDFHTPADLLSKWVSKIDVAAWVNDGNVSGGAPNP